MAIDVLQQLQQWSGAFGPVAATAVGFLSRTVKRIITDLTDAQTKAEAAKVAAEAARALAAGLADSVQKAHATATGINEAFQSLRSGLRMEVDAFKQEVQNQLRAMSDTLEDADDQGPAGGLLKRLHRETIVPIEERVVLLEEKLRSVDRELRGSRPGFGAEEETGRFFAIRTTIDHEQEQRRALQETLVAHMREEAERWLKLERTMGSTEAKMDSWTHQAERQQRHLEDLQHRLEAIARGR